VLGVEPRIVHISSQLLRAADPQLFSHLYYERTFVGLFDTGKIRSVAPDFVCNITLNAGLKMMLEWFDRWLRGQPEAWEARWD